MEQSLGLLKKALPVLLLGGIAFFSKCGGGKDDKNDIVLPVVPPAQKPATDISPPAKDTATYRKNLTIDPSDRSFKTSLDRAAEDVPLSKDGKVKAVVKRKDSTNR